MTKQQSKLEALKRQADYIANKEHYDFLIMVITTLQSICLECADDLNTVMPQVINNRMVKDLEYFNNAIHYLMPMEDSAIVADEINANKQKVWDLFNDSLK
jgi:hypothetical protein